VAVALVLKAKSACSCFTGGGFRIPADVHRGFGAGITAFANGLAVDTPHRVLCPEIAGAKSFEPIHCLFLSCRDCKPTVEARSWSDNRSHDVIRNRRRRLARRRRVANPSGEAVARKVKRFETEVSIAGRKGRCSEAEVRANRHGAVGVACV
jgi:hypothetical protein